jgi:hypothetical protein
LILLFHLGVIANDLRPLFDGFAPDEKWRTHTLNSAFGRAATMLDAPQQDNVLLLFVGSSSPTIYLNADKSLSIVREEYDDESNQLVAYGPDAIATVYTDLWWVSICDGDEFDRRQTLNPQDDIEIAAELLVTPGIWSWDYYGLLDSFDSYSSSAAVYSTGEFKSNLY